MRILVTFAVEAEFAPWRKRTNFVPISRPTPIGLKSSCCYRGTVCENDVDVLLTGIGWDETKGGNRPRFVLRELLRNKPDVCISSGLAGGLKADLQCGDIVAATEVSLRTGRDTFRSSANLLLIAKEAGAQVGLTQITETHIKFEPAAKSALPEFDTCRSVDVYTHHP